MKQAKRHYLQTHSLHHSLHAQSQLRILLQPHQSWGWYSNEVVASRLCPPFIKAPHYLPQGWTNRVSHPSVVCMKRRDNVTLVSKTAVRRPHLGMGSCFRLFHVNMSGGHRENHGITGKHWISGTKPAGCITSQTQEPRK